MKEPDFLTLAEAAEIHDYQLEQHGGRPGLRDPGLEGFAALFERLSKPLFPL